ncbi:hypothetical protein Ahia01_000430000 [Argonauta hians]
MLRRKTWNDAVKEDLRKLRLPMELTMDRGSWRAAVQERTRNPLSNRDKFLAALMEDANLPGCRARSTTSTTTTRYNFRSSGRLALGRASSQKNPAKHDIESGPGKPDSVEPSNPRWRGTRTLNR